MLGQHDPDIELGPAPTRLEGYPSFAIFIARDIDAAIYRKCTRLSARNLLYLPSKFHELERRLQDYDREDAKGNNNDEAQQAARRWNHYCSHDCEKASQRRNLHSMIRTKINEYRG